MTLRLYIAASSHPDERARVDAAFASVSPFFDIVGDWRPDVDKFGGNPGGDASEFAIKDLRAVDLCQVMWVLLPSNPSRGLWFEFGYAHKARKAIYASGNRDQSVFAMLVERWSLDDALMSETLRQLASGGPLYA